MPKKPQGAAAPRRKSRPSAKRGNAQSARRGAHHTPTFNNTIVTIHRHGGPRLGWASAGSRRLKGSRKGRRLRPQLACEAACKEGGGLRACERFRITSSSGAGPRVGAAVAAGSGFRSP